VTTTSRMTMSGSEEEVVTGMAERRCQPNSWRSELETIEVTRSRHI
jgi:hypothetical protein